jgi:hypothetical protein
MKDWQHQITEMSRKWRRKEIKFKTFFMSRDKMNTGYTGNNCNHLRVIKSLAKNMEAIPGKHSIDSLQKAVLERYT